MTILRSIFILFIGWLILTSSGWALLVVNEVMVNEPGSSTSLEWFELYNDSPTEISSMSLYTITTTANNITFNNFSLAAYSYLVVCRDSAAFKIYWSDQFSTNIKLYQASFSFSNSGSGFIQLFRAGILHSELSWSDAGADGISWERLSSPIDSVSQSVDQLGCTPGFLNSLTLVAYDIALEDIFINSFNDTTWLTYLIVNRGENLFSDGVLRLFYYNEANPDNESDVIAILDIPPVEVGYTTVINEPYLLPGRYRHLGAALSDDSRNRNNRLYFYAPGSDFPPFIISEFLANPETGSVLNSEWIELKNRFNESISLTGWKIGDRYDLLAIADDVVIINPDEYFVLVEDSLSFLDYYPDYSGRLIQPDGWSRLNNDEDVVRLVDSFSIVADTIVYLKVFDSNYTWSRSETIDRENYWGRSEKPGGTPGEVNAVKFEPQGGGLVLKIEPPIISPDGDGYEDYAAITFDGPIGADYTLKLYDCRGNLIKTFFEDEMVFDEEYQWSGRTDDGRRLPIGIYIVYLEATGAGEIKKTVVLAR